MLHKGKLTDKKITNKTNKFKNMKNESNPITGGEKSDGSDLLRHHSSSLNDYSLNLFSFS